MADILVFSEVTPVACELISKARDFGGTVAAAMIVKSSPDDLFAYGAQQVYVSDAPQLAAFNADVYAEAVAQIAQASGAKTILIGSTRRGKELAGRLAQKFGCGAVTDAIGLAKQADGTIAVQRYGLGGNTIATEVIVTDRQVISVMPRTFEAVKQHVTGQVVTIDLQLPEPRVKVIERKPKAAATANIESSEVLVVVGKGFAKQADLAIADTLAKQLHAEIACTRALSADYHWLGEDRMIGISGKKAKPRLMVSLGVSGQIQHTVGILGSKFIVAVNKDKSAPIFKITDYGIVGDLYQVVPKLAEKLHSS